MILAKDRHILLLLLVLFILSTGSHIYHTVETYEKSMRGESYRDAQVLALVFKEELREESEATFNPTFFMIAADLFPR